MSVLNHLAQAAAVILLIELLVVLLAMVAVAGGLAFGLHWVLGKADWAFDKVNDYVALGVKYLHQGTDFAGKPFIVTSAWAERVKGTARAVQQRARADRGSRLEMVTIASGPGAVEQAQEDSEASVPLA